MGHYVLDFIGDKIADFAESFGGRGAYILVGGAGCLGVATLGTILYFSFPEGMADDKKACEIKYDSIESCIEKKPIRTSKLYLYKLEERLV